jgi:hypothetical protein
MVNAQPSMKNQPLKAGQLISAFQRLKARPPAREFSELLRNPLRQFLPSAILASLVFSFFLYGFQSR